MNNNLTKFAASAAVLIMVITIGLTSLTSSKPAYALEQTIEAFKKVRFIHIIMRDDGNKIVDERWIEVGPDGLQDRYRQESDMMGQSVLIVDDGQTCFFHDRIKNIITAAR